MLKLNIILEAKRGGWEHTHLYTQHDSRRRWTKEWISRSEYWSLYSYTNVYEAHSLTKLEYYYIWLEKQQRQMEWVAGAQRSNTNNASHTEWMNEWNDLKYTDSDTHTRNNYVKNWNS